MSTENEVEEETTSNESEDTSVEELDLFSMDDEAIMSMPDPVDETGDSNESEASDEITDSDSTSQEGNEEDTTSDSEDSEVLNEGSTDGQDIDAEVTATDSEPSDDSNEKSKDDNENVEGFTAEQQVEKILSPFQANGKQIQVDNVDDAITLMKMGANYNKKMAVMKPNLKYIKMLDNAGLLDASKLSNLIDLKRKDPAAIKQLIKDSGIDPLEIDVEEDTGYKPETYTVSDSELELDLVLADLKSSPKYGTTLDVINNKFDAASKEVLVNNPEIIRVLNEHIHLGHYDKITDVVERERMLGRLVGLTDLQAYKQVSDAINANGGLPTENATAYENTKPSTQKTNTVKKDEGKTNKRKKSAAVTKSSPGAKKSSTPDFMSMSDEEIENFPVSKYK